MADEGTKKTTQAELEHAINKADSIVAAFGAILEQVGEPGIHLYPESGLPFTKLKIREAIEILLLIPTDDTRRDNLEAVDVLLNDFVSDEEYRVVYQQRIGLSKALKSLSSGEKLDGLQLAKAMGEGVTQEGETQLRQINDRVKRENETTLERHRELRHEADRLRQTMQQQSAER
jgi:hypothetical protein